MAEILTKESETGELEIFTSGAPTTLSNEQIEHYTNIIRDNYEKFLLKAQKKSFSELKKLVNNL